MIVSCHGLMPDLASDVVMARERIRAGTMGAEDALHDLGLIPITSSDAQGMGRATVCRTLALAGKMKAERDTEPRAHDNDRVLRYLAKLTINPAIAHGLAHEVGSLEIGKLADIVLWEPAFFGAKPQLVLKGGFPAYRVTGDPQRLGEHRRTPDPGAAVPRVRGDPGRHLGGLRLAGRRRGRWRRHADQATTGRGARHARHRFGGHGAQLPLGRCRREPRERQGHPRRRTDGQRTGRLRLVEPDLLPVAPPVHLSAYSSWWIGP